MSSTNAVVETIPEFSTVSSKGQIVIPHNLREKLNISKGNVFVVTTFDNLLVLKKVAGSLSEEELETLEDIKKGWEEIGEGKFKASTKKEFLEEIEKW